MLRNVRGKTVGLSLLLATMLLSSCGSNGDDESTAAEPSVTQQSPTTASPVETTSSTPSAPTADAGPVQVQAVASVTDHDGYQARVTVRWHVLQPVAASAIFADCPLMGKPRSNEVFRASVVEGTAEFPVVNGFTWPAKQRVEVELEPTGAEANFSICYPGPGPYDESPAEFGHVNVTSGSGSTWSVMLVQHTPRTPNNPDGTFTSSPQTWGVRIYAPGNGQCALSGAKDADLTSAACTMRYAA